MLSQPTIMSIQEIERDQTRLSKMSSLQTQLTPLLQRHNQLTMEILGRKLKEIDQTKHLCGATLATLNSTLTAKATEVTETKRLIATLEGNIKTIEEKNARIQELSRLNSELQQQLPFLQPPSLQPIGQTPHYGNTVLCTPTHVDVAYVPHDDHFDQAVYVHSNPYHQTNYGAFNRSARIHPTYIQPVHDPIAQYQTRIANNQTEISRLQSSLVAFNPLQNRYTSLTSLQETLAQQQTKLAELEEVKKGIRAEIDSNLLTQYPIFLTRIKALNEHTKADLALGSWTIPNLEGTAMSLSARIEPLTLEQKALEDIQNNLLITHPASLVTKLANDMKTKFRDFEINHPANQSRHVRRCLFNVVGKIDGFLMKLTAPLDVTVAQTTYYQLYGMLTAFQNFIDEEVFDSDADSKKFCASIKAFKSTLTVLRQNASIHANRPLFMDEEYCNQRYTLLVISMDFHLFHEVSIEELFRFEQMTFQETLNQISVVADYHDSTTIFPTTKNIIAETKAAMAALTPAQQQDHYKFFTMILDKVNEVVKVNTIDKQNHTLAAKTAVLDDLSKLITATTFGAPSFFKKFVGAVLMLIGTLITALSVSAKFMTAGASAPLSIPGMVCGSAVFLSGAGLFSNGMRKGLSKQLTNLHTEINKLDDSPPPYSARASA